ncbi:MAG: HlyD family efflux transporter periplasmic adaptor subunit [Pirellulaceae bacterium]
MVDMTNESQNTSPQQAGVSLPPPSVRANGGWSFARVLAMVIILAIVIGLGAYGSSQLIGNLGSEPASTALTHTVKRGELLVTVTEDGNVESASNLDIKCEVAGGSSILWIVEDGKRVEEGEKLVELDQSQLEEQISQQKITFEKARSASIQASKDYEVAQIAVEEYLEGTFKKELQDADAQITIALENLRTAQNTLGYTQRMFRKGYVSQLELEGQQFAVQRAQLELDSANTAKEVLEKFSKVKTLKDLKSQVETAQARMQAEKAAFDLEESRLKRLQDQLEHCVVHAPSAGMVVYANEQSRSRFGSSQGPQIEEGAQVRERQTILRLPDLTQMQVKVAVHETKVESLSRGMRARIMIQNRDLLGTVTSIANQPEPTSFFSASVKEYGTIVRIEGETEGLKPGMTAEVEILVAHLKDAITLPVAAIVEQRGGFYCWVRKGEQNERRPLVLGVSDDQFVEVKEGVAEGEEVLLNPRAVVDDARRDDSEKEEADVNARFGGEGASPATGPQGRGERRGSPGGSGRGPGSGGPPAGGARESGRGGGPPAGSHRGGSPRDLMQSDQDGDGKISKDEAPEFMQSFFDRVDGNGDGFLDKNEIQAMRSRGGGDGHGGSGRGGSGRGGMRNLMEMDKDGDGKVTKEEAPDLPEMFFDRIDSDGDGAVSQEEIDAMRSRFGGGGGGRDAGGGGGREDPGRGS